MIVEKHVLIKASFNENTKLGKLQCNKIIDKVKGRKFKDTSAWPLNISFDNIQISVEPDHELQMFTLKVNKNPYLDLPYGPKFDATEIEEDDVSSIAAATF